MQFYDNVVELIGNAPLVQPSKTLPVHSVILFHPPGHPRLLHIARRHQCYRLGSSPIPPRLIQSFSGSN